jgi:two-component system, NtrC family, response regulator AtoC
MGRVLIVDDDRAVLFALKEVVRERGHEAVAVASGAEALEKLDGVDAAVTDFNMPGMNGLELMRAIREREPALPVVMLTAHGSERVAVDAMKAGAYDYVPKPFDIDEIGLVIDRALETAALRTSNRRLRAEQAIGRRIIGTSAPLRRLLDAVARIAAKDVTVLVGGETGTGKELVASLLHAQSKRADGSLVRFNCAALPADLAEAELFGHARGAFTGANTARQGFFARAHGGTLVLDEVGELPLAIQAKLLRAVQEGEVQPVGAGRTEKVDVRIVASTNRDLATEARAGRFREDLYFRLAVIELVIPPLRERREDIPALANEFARIYGDRFGTPGVKLSPALVAGIAAAEWPGNVRQLENAVARMVALGTGDVIDVDAWPGGAAPAPKTNANANANAKAEDETETPDASDDLGLREQVEAFERNVVARALAAAHGNQSEAARRLRTNRMTLSDKIKKYGLGSS